MNDPARHLRLAVLLSGTGRTLENLVRHRAEGRLQADLVCVASNRAGVRGLDVARDAGIDHAAFRLSEHAGERARRDRAMAEWVLARDPDLVLLAGYLALLDVAAFGEVPVLNIHPALLPRHGGEGYHGRHVHAAVLAAGDRTSGCSVHRVDEVFDRGEVLARREVPVLESDDVDALAARVFEAECELYPAVVNAIARGEIPRRPGR